MEILSFVTILAIFLANVCPWSQGTNGYVKKGLTGNELQMAVKDEELFSSFKLHSRSTVSIN